MLDKEVIPMRLRKLRKEKNLTMKQLGNIVGVTECAISQYELGKREPSNETLFKLADVFDVSVDYLLGRDEEQKTPVPEDERDREILERFSKLSATDAAKVSAFIEGLLASKE